MIQSASLLNPRSFQCPFHGKIIARDESGRAADPDEEHLEPSTSSGQLDWQDPDLLRDIEAQIGIDLTMPKKGQRRKKVRSARRRMRTPDSVRWHAYEPNVRFLVSLTSFLGERWAIGY